MNKTDKSDLNSTQEMTEKITHGPQLLPKVPKSLIYCIPYTVCSLTPFNRTIEHTVSSRTIFYLHYFPNPEKHFIKLQELIALLFEQKYNM